LRSFDLLCIPIWVLIIPDSSTRTLAITSRHLVAKLEKVGEKLQWILPVKYLFVPVGFLHMPQNLMTWDQQLYFPSKEVMLWILIAQIHCPWPGMNLWTLDPMTSTLTTRSPRVTSVKVAWFQNEKTWQRTWYSRLKYMKYFTDMCLHCLQLKLLLIYYW
jgi:hypothetical protein